MAEYFLGVGGVSLGSEGARISCVGRGVNVVEIEVRVDFFSEINRSDEVRVSISFCEV